MNQTRDEFSESFSVGVSLPIQIFDRGQGPLGRGRVGARAARLRLEARLGEARAELERALALLYERRRALRDFDREVAATLPELREMAEVSYTEGGASIFELLDSLQALRELRLAELDLIESAALAETEALWATGLLDPPIPAR